MPYEVTDFWTWTWLRAWAPTFWYGTALVTLWLGSGVFVFRSLLRTSHSHGWLRISSAESPAVLADHVVWTFSSMWVLILAAILGPLLSLLFALGYVCKARRKVAASRMSRKA